MQPISAGTSGALPNGAPIVDVRTYEEFVHIDCQLVLLVVDCVYGVIYCKDQETLARLYRHANSSKLKHVEYVTDENDCRSRLSVW
ncbi:DUF2691 family protein [Paenibacillus chartarius]|uniref:DUF2691 family protein n=1 Tax=Paenibacillus chartarius TaxID=747481 RepID=A0ABV6DL98_9BACL